MERTEKTHRQWTKMYLSRGGILFYFNPLSLNFPPTMSLYPICDSVASKLGKIQRDFSWVEIGWEKKGVFISSIGRL